MRRALAIMALSFVSGCGGSTAAPEVPLPFSGRLALGDGRRFLTIVGDPERCGDIRDPQSGTSVSVDINSSSDGGGWTLRPLDGTGGQFEVRIERMLGTGMFGGVPLSGTARGYAVDSSAEPFVTPTGTIVTLADAGAAPLRFRGVMTSSSLASGSFQGTVTFSRNGVVSSCPAGAVMWSVTNSTTH
jgi:hypothetical protein